MKVLGQPVALILGAALLWLLAIAHPLAWLQARDAAVANSKEQRALDPAAQYVARLWQSDPLRSALRDQSVIGYLSESEIDVRGDGSGQARYYLSQFALAPVLLELDSSRTEGTEERDLVFAAFQHSQQLSRYLNEHARRAIVSLNANMALTRAREP